MADWFKFFNDSIDEPLLQWAISEQSEVLPVWTLLLCECSKHYSDTIPWRDKDVELLGYARKINVSPAKLNSALGLLARIDYLEKGSGTLKVLKWNEVQSEYCQKRSKKCPDTVPTVSRQYPDNVALEERRGEEIRVQTRSKRNLSADADVCMIYELYPRKVARKIALRKIDAAVTLHGLKVVLEATRTLGGLWKRATKEQLRYCPHPATWFGQERFLDDPESWEPKSELNGHPRPKTIVQKDIAELQDEVDRL